MLPVKRITRDGQLVSGHNLVFSLPSIIAQHTSVYPRLPFHVPWPFAFDSLSLNPKLPLELQHGIVPTLSPRTQFPDPEAWREVEDGPKAPGVAVRAASLFCRTSATDATSMATCPSVEATGQPKPP